MHISKINNKKLIKEKILYDSAFELFQSKGVNDTSIDDIVKKAGVAKGTFYLYFKDKYDIIDKLILRKSSVILKEALEKTNQMNFENLSDGVIFFTDYLIEYFKENKRLLKIIHKNLSWGLYRKAVANAEQHDEMNILRNELLQIMKRENISLDEIEKELFMIIELTGSVCYSSIILEEPVPIEEFKPYLFKMLRKMLSK